MADIQSTLSGDNLKVFQVNRNERVDGFFLYQLSTQDCVEVHMQHIQQGLSQMGNLTAFMAGSGDK